MGGEMRYIWNYRDERKKPAQEKRKKDNQIKTLIIMAHNETLCAGKNQRRTENFCSQERIRTAVHRIKQSP